MATTMKDLMGLRRWALLAAGVTLMSALVLSLGATKAFAAIDCDPTVWSCQDPPSDPPLSVNAISPFDGTTGVSRNTNIRVYFSEPMNPDSFNANTLLLSPEAPPPVCETVSNLVNCEGGGFEPVPATVSMVPDTNQRAFEFDPYGSGSGRLEPNKKYTWSVGWGVQSSDGTDYYSSRVYSFYTGGGSAPTVTAVSPPDGATGISRSTNIKVTFSEAMDPATINTSTFQLHFYDSLCDRYTGTCNFSSYQIPATVRKDPTDATGRTYLLDPYGATSQLLSMNRRYRVTLTTGVRDLEDEYPIPSNKVWYFKTGSW